MAATFNLQITTPEREIFNRAVISATLPGMAGSFGVLASHAPLVAGLDAGTVEIRDGDGTSLRLAIGGGFFQVLNNEAILLADSAEMSEDIDATRATEAEGRARSRLAGQIEPATEMQRERAEAALKRARARMRVATGR